MKSNLTDGSPFTLRPTSLPRSTLVLASLEIGRAVADRDAVTFRAQGTCMYPTLRTGDVLRIRSCTVADVDVGEIAVCRTPDYLFGHRVIAKGERDGRAYIITRPDRGSEGSDAPTFDENLLGVVVAVARKGKPMPLRSASYPWLTRRYYSARLALTEAERRARFWLANQVARAQKHGAYRRIARAWWVFTRPHITYAVQLPFNGKLGESVHRRLIPEEFDLRMDWRGRSIERWTLALHLNNAREPAAGATFAYNSAGEWGIAEMFVRLRYRGMGLEDALLLQAREILAGGRKAERPVTSVRTLLPFRA